MFILNKNFLDPDLTSIDLHGFLHVFIENLADSEIDKSVDAWLY